MTLPASDNFNRANGAPGANWTGSVGGDLTIVSNALQGAGAGDNSMYWSADSPNAAQAAQATIATIAAGYFAGPCVRASATDWVCGDANGGTNWQIEWYNGGAFTVIASWGTAPANGDIAKITANGSAFELFVNGTSRASGSNGSAPSTGYGGIYIHNSSSAVVDDFSIDNLYTIEQEGFRFGEDDGNEAAHGWTEAQDTNITTADNVAKLLRILVNGTGDIPATAFTLRYQKNGAGGYVAVPVGASVETPASVRGSATSAGGTSASGGIAITLPTRVSGDILFIAWTQDWNGNTPSFSHNGSGWTTKVNTDNGTVVGLRVIARICTNDTNDNITITGIAQDYSYVCWAVRDHGVADLSADITVGTTATGTNAAPNPPNCNPGSTKTYLWLEGFSSDDDDDTATYWSTDYTGVAQQQSASSTSSCLTAVASRSLSASSEDPGTMAMAATEEWIAWTMAVPPLVTNNDIYINPSGNIAAGGEATTARLTAPSGKTTSDFTTGRRWDDENGTDTTDIANNFYSEFEYSLKVKSGLSHLDVFDLRLYEGSTPFATYTLTARWTISTGLSATVNQVTETDTAQPITRIKQREIAQISETDLAQAIARQKIFALAQVNETDTAQAIARIKQKLIAQVLEIDEAQPVTQPQTIVPVNHATETDTAQAITSRKVKIVGQVAETDIAQAISKLKSRLLGQVSESDVAQALTSRKVKGIAQVNETDSAQAILRQKIRAVAQVIETDIAQAISKLKTRLLGQVSETDLAQPVTRLAGNVIQQVEETDLAQALTSRKVKVVGQVSETDIAQALAKVKQLLVAQVSETDTAQGITSRKVLAVAQALETDLAQALFRQKRVMVLQVFETDLAFSITPSGQIVLGLAQLSTRLVEVAALTVFTPWTADLSDQAREAATLEDAPL
jgi:hypothetical protein